MRKSIRGALATLALVAGLLALGVSPIGDLPAADAETRSGTGSSEVSTIRIVVLPPDTTFGQLEALEFGAVGFLGIAQHRVDPKQVFVDISQGSRVRPGLYAKPLRLFNLGSEPPGNGWWNTARDRSSDVGLPGTPGMLAAALRGDGWVIAGDPENGPAGLMVIDVDGPRMDYDHVSCPAGSKCLLIESSTVEQLPMEPASIDELVIAFPYPEEGRRIAPVLVVGSGYETGGTVTSSSTRMDGLVISTDITATVLKYAGIDPATVTEGESIEGQPIVVSQGSTAASVRQIEERLDSIESRRLSVIGTALAIWLVASALLWIFQPARRRTVVLILAVSLALLPAAFLATAALRPVPGVEFVLVMTFVPVLAWLLGRVFAKKPLLAFAAAALLSVASLAVDMIAGSVLTPFSLLGPNPAYGARFYGIGNELEAVIGCLVPLGTASALAAYTRSRRGGLIAVVTFLAVGAAAATVFAASKWGADVGAAMIIPAGVAAAAAVSVNDKRVWLVSGVAMCLGLAALIASDLLIEGDSHFTRTILDAGSPERVVEVLGRRLEMTANSFTTLVNAVLLLAIFAGAVFAWTRRLIIRRWFAGRRSLWAGSVGAIAAVAAGTVVNDSGALFLIFGAVYVLAFLGVSWATSRSNGRQED